MLLISFSQIAQLELQKGLVIKTMLETNNKFIYCLLRFNFDIEILLNVRAL